MEDERDPVYQPRHYFAEINATHPFRDGNGRTQRAFVSQLVTDAGYRIEWARLDPERNVDPPPPSGTPRQRSATTGDL
ncbi:MAG: Fic family protein [Solirubrobacteraceae bacterium]